jgi:hypothetical protein
MKEKTAMPETPEVPDLSGHPTVEAVSFGERSGIAGLHQPPKRTAEEAPKKPAGRTRAAGQRARRPKKASATASSAQMPDGGDAPEEPRADPGDPGAPSDETTPTKED